MAAARAAGSLYCKLNVFAPAREAASVAVRNSVLTSCIQATSTANAAMIITRDSATVIKTNMAPWRRGFFRVEQ